MRVRLSLPTVLAATLSLLAFVAVPLRVAASPFIMSFDELPPQTFEELEVSGVTMAVGTEALFGASTPSTYFFETPGLLVSTTDTLTFDFLVPTTIVEFVVGTNDDYSGDPPALTVELFDESGTSMGASTFEFDRGGFVEHAYRHDGQHVSRAVVTLGASEPSYLLDNLGFVDVYENRQEVIGAAGADGAPGASGPVGETGGSGTAGAGAAVTANSTEPGNRAIAIGGDGGEGGQGGNASDPATQPAGAGGAGGAGGAADASATSIVAEASQKAQAVAEATGGMGGRGGRSGSSYVLAPWGAAGAGGDATGTARATSSSGDAVAEVEVSGGAGGYSEAGDGGAASGSAIATSTEGGRARASVIAVGGDGGHGQYVGGGAGADATLVDAVDAFTSGEIELWQEARGGYGGGTSARYDSASGGAAGDAISSLAKTKDSAHLELVSRAIAGNVGYRFYGEDVAPVGGGRAEALGWAENRGGGVAVEVLAQAGGGSSVPGGDARVTATAITTGDGQGIRVGTSEGSTTPSIPIFGAFGGRGGGSAVSSSTATALGDSRVEVYDFAYAGYGDDDGGDGGNATSSASGSNAGSESVTVRANARARSGGAGDGGGRGGDGGSATATASGVSSGGGDVDVTASAGGGSGGSDRSAGVNGGDGGAATATAYGESTTGDVTVTVIQRTGRAGELGSGDSGTSPASIADNAVSGRTAGTLTLVQSVNGGNGSGSGVVLSRLHGQNSGGGAIVSVAEAVAGDSGGVGGAAQVGVSAVSFTASATAIGRARSYSETQPVAGRAGDGTSASLVAQAVTFGHGHAVTVGSADELASGAGSGNGGTGTASIAGGDGGMASSSSIGTANGNSSVTVIDRAEAGWGGHIVSGEVGVGGRGGIARSTARGSNQGDAAVAVSSDARGGRGAYGGTGGVAGSGGDAFATSLGESTGAAEVTVDALAIGGNLVLGIPLSPGATGGNSTADATATSLGHATASAQALAGYTRDPSSSGLARAHALASGSSGSATSDAYAKHDRGMNLRARAIAEVASEAETDARASIGGLVQRLAEGAKPDAYMFATGEPLAGEVAQFLSGAPPNVWRVAPGALAIGEFGVFSREPSATSVTRQTELSLMLYDRDFASNDIVALSFLDIGIGAADFESLEIQALISGQVVLDLSFDDSDAALSQLTNRVFELGEIPGAGTTNWSMSTLELNISFTAANSDASFVGGWLLGTVPEPSTGLLFAFGLIGIALERRRHRRVH